MWSPLSNIHRPASTYLCLSGWTGSRETVRLILSSCPSVCLAQSRWSYMTLCGMDGWMDEVRKNSTLHAHLPSSSAFPFHLSELRLHLPTVPCHVTPPIDTLSSGDATWLLLLTHSAAETLPSITSPSRFGSLSRKSQIPLVTSLTRSSSLRIISKGPK